MKTTRWIIPEAKEPAAQSSRDASAGGSAALGRPIRIGLLDNTKDNADLLLTLISEQVKREISVEFVRMRKGNATVGAPAEILDDLAREADCVISAMAD